MSRQHHYQLAMAQAGLGDTDAMQKELEKAIELDPNHLPARVALARSLLAQQDKVRIRGAGRSCCMRCSRIIRTCLLLEASLAKLKGNNDEALAKLEQAYAAAPTPVTVQNLALEKLLRGDKPGGLKLLEGWVAKHPQDTATRMVLADLYVAEKRDASAVAQYEAVVDADARNVVALNNLAWYLRKTDPKRALAYAKRASKIAPDAAPVLDTLALVLLENKEFDKAQSRIEQALKMAPKDPGMRYHAALIRNALGDTGGAILILEPVVNGADDFPEKREAGELLALLKKK